jgi:hypothetical protein
VKTHFKIVVIDETDHWIDDIQKRAGAVWVAYMFDSLRHVHACEITPSYELWPLYATAWNRTGNDEVDEELESEIIQWVGSDVEYHHVSSIERLPAARFYDCGEEEHDDDETWEEIRERVEDHYRGNVAIQFPAGYDGPPPPPVLHEYAFDVKLFASLRVKAATEEEAREKLRSALDCADTHFGQLDGEPLTAEASIDGEPELYEIDGEPT